MNSNRIRIGILGASGYTGAELVRLLSQHPRSDIVLMTADRNAGEAYDSVFPHLGGLELPGLISIDEVEWAGLDVDVVFCGLPHGTTQEVIAGLLHATGHSAIAVRADVSKPAEVRALFDAAERELGRVDVLVNNAGVL